MPSDQSIWLEECQRLKAGGSWTVKPNPEYTLVGAKAVPLVIAVGYPCQLLAQGKHLEMERGPAPQEVGQGGEQRNEYCFHSGNATWAQTEKSTKSMSTEFLVGTATLFIPVACY